jgi:hypothetical protein
MSEEKILILNAVPNPDRGQSRPLAPGSVRIVSTWAEASRAARVYIEKYNLGAGNWPDIEIATMAGEPVARVSYNGRVWDLNGVCLYDPPADKDNTSDG